MRLHALLAATLLVACGSKDDTGAGTDTDTTPQPDTYEPTWAGMEQMFTDHCDRCHPSVNGIDLRAEIRADIEQGNEYYVVVGDADLSLLWVVVGTGTLAFMPTDGQLPAESVAHVKEWINSGASLD